MRKLKSNTLNSPKDIISGNNFIGNVLSAKGNRTFRTINPETNNENPTVFIQATSIEINEACQKAHEAFNIYRNINPVKRALFLHTIADEIEELGDTLLEMYCKESGLPNSRAIAERTRTLFQLHSFAEMLHSKDWLEISIDHPLPHRSTSPKPELRKMKIPLGPVAVFGSSNFPFAYSTAGGDTASALAAGCPVIVKSHPMHAGTGEMVATAILRAAESTGMPDGVFSNLNGIDYEIGNLIVEHPHIKAVGFTGSLQGGRALFDIANKRPEPIPVFAEMGSINPVIISTNSLINKSDYWAKSYAHSITQGTGQFCTNPGLIIAVKSPKLDDFIQTLSKEILVVESGLMLHPSIKRNFEIGREEILSQTGVHKITDNNTTIKDNYAEQTLVTVSGDEFIHNPKLHREVFGPFSIIVQCDDLKQIQTIVQALEGQLTGTIIAEKEEYEYYLPIIEALQYLVGRIIFNGVPTGVEVCPSMNHGGPYPASTDSRFTAVGIHSVNRWLRSVTFQNFPKELLPEAIR